jgi:hypothetical protein
VNGIGAGDFRGGDDAGNPEVRFPGRGRADADVIVREPDVQGFAIRFRVDRDRFDVQFLARADHAQRDLAAVGDQDFLEHSDIQY